MKVVSAVVRGIYCMGTPRRIRREDVQEAVRIALPWDCETILTMDMEFAVDGEGTRFPLEKVGQRLEVTYRAVVVRAAFGSFAEAAQKAPTGAVGKGAICVGDLNGPECVAALFVSDRTRDHFRLRDSE
jgi:hypothetical protein